MLLGSFTANKYPHYYYAFISVGQVGNQVRSENLAYEFVLSRAKELKDKKAIRIIEEIGPPPYADPKEALRKMFIERKYLITYGGAIKNGEFYPKAIREGLIIRPLILLRKITLTRCRLW